MTIVCLKKPLIAVFFNEPSTARRVEDELGLMYYRARFYDTETGRFLTKDPLTGGPDDPRVCYKTNIYSFFDRVITESINSLDPHNTNRYVYCRNNPINFTDPLGLWAWDNDLVQKGIGGMLGFYGKESAKAGWGHVAETAKRSSPIGKIVYAKENAQATIAQTKSRYETQRGGGAGKTEAAINTGIMVVNDVTGGTNIVEAVSGTSLDDGRNLTGIERGSKALTGVGQVAATAAAAGKGIDVVKASKAPYPNVDKLDFSTPHNKATFYSGPGQGARAQSFAKKSGGMTIEMTRGGKQLMSDPLFKQLSPSQQYQVWQKASKSFAKGASGKINAFTKGARSTGIFKTIEEPALKANRNVNRHRYHY